MHIHKGFGWLINGAAYIKGYAQLCSRLGKVYMWFEKSLAR